MRIGTRRTLAAAGALAMAMALGACKDHQGGGAAAVNEIVVGEYGSMTGSEATFGQSTHNGLTMAIEEINAAGGIKGKKVKLVSYDDQGKTSEVGTAVTRLITSDEALAVIGEVASSLSIAGGQICQQHGVPMISPSSTNPRVTETGDYVFRVCFIDPFQGFVMAKFMTDAPAQNGLGLKKAALLVDQRQAYAQGLARDFDAALGKLGGTVVANEKYQGGDQDFSAQLTRIKAAAPEAIYIPGYYTDVANIAKQVRAIGITVPLLGGDGWESVTDIGGSGIDGAFYSNHYAPEDNRPEVQRFVATYKGRYQKTPDSMAALGYDAMMLLKNAVERAPGGDLPAWRKSVRDAIATTKDFQGVTGRISIDAGRNATKPAVVLQIHAAQKQAVFRTSISPP
jgi:branched-chain amino acid transport system substrate-binding protein